jgi:uncharacterized protein with von Willebrand factor type A (vWA) domain
MPNSKQDRSTVAGKQDYEVYYFKKRYNVGAKDVRRVMKELKTHSRKKIMAKLEEEGLIKTADAATE